LTQQVHWLDFNKGLLLLEMNGTNIKKKLRLFLHIAGNVFIRMDTFVISHEQQDYY
jgi:hypothetical protein